MKSEKTLLKCVSFFLITLCAGILKARVLVFLSPGIWQQRQIAHSFGDGLYELTINVPETGVYLLFIESPGQHLRYRDLPYLTLHASATQ